MHIPYSSGLVTNAIGGTGILLNTITLDNLAEVDNAGFICFGSTLLVKDSEINRNTITNESASRMAYIVPVNCVATKLYIKLDIASLTTPSGITIFIDIMKGSSNTNTFTK